MEKLILEIESFRKWLMEKGDSVAGNPAENNSCPIANWLHDSGMKETRVGTRVLWLDGKVGLGEGVPLPKWAMCFITKVDRQHKSAVYAARCLEYLQECERELEKMEQPAADQG